MTIRIRLFKDKLLGCMLSVFTASVFSIPAATAQESEFLGVITNHPLARELELSPKELNAYLEEQFGALSSAQFHDRRLGREALLRHPAQTLDLLAKVDIVDGTRAVLDAVELAAELATHVEYRISTKAQALLDDFSKLPTYAGNRAAATLNAISDLAEVKAMQSVVLHGGVVDNRSFSLRGGGFATTSEVRLKLDENFDKDGEAISRIPSLKSVVTLVMDDISVEAPLAKSLANLKNVRLVIFWHVEINLAALEFLRALPKLQEVEFNYVDIDDTAVDLLATIPVSTRLALYGTKITANGAEELSQRLDNVEVFRGSGGFLGVATSPTNTIVSRVVEKSGAWNAGIEIDDKLTAIDGVPIKNFDDLRRELGKHVVKDQVAVSLERPVIDQASRKMTVQVILGEKIPEE